MIIKKKNKENRDILLEMFKNIKINDRVKAEIGNTLMLILKESCKELNYKKIIEDNKSYLKVTFNEEFYDELFFQSIKTVFLPMITRPKLWSEKRKGGYISEVMNDYANPDNQIIKSNPKLIINSRIFEKQIDCINYMNNVPFIINRDVLHYLTIEWDKDESIIFKGLNKLHLKTDLVKDKKYKMDNLLFKEIQAQNSKHYNLLNTLMIATLYKDQVFYISTLLDFRGRIYSKVAYLSYQGGDLARSLIKFYAPKDNIYKYIVFT